MQEMMLIPLTTPNAPATGSSAMLSTQAPGLQNSRDIAPIVAAKNGNAFPLHSATEHNPSVADEKVETLVENLFALQNGEGYKMAKSDKFGWVFSSWHQCYIHLNHSNTI